YWQDQAARTHIQLTQEDRERPLGIITPVATSATLGGSGGGQDMLDFAETIFGERFAHDALITESRMDFETWKNQSSPGAAANRDIEDISYLITDTNKKIENDATSATTLTAVLEALFTTPPETSPVAVFDALRHHPVTERIIDLTSSARDIFDLAQQLFPDLHTANEQTAAAEFLSHVLALFSYIRVEIGRSALTVETHLWVRELSRIDARVDTALEFRWGDDPLEEPEEPTGDTAPATYLPAIYCRHCGRNGWGTLLAPNDSDIITDPAEIRKASANHDAQFRAMLD